MSKNNFVLVSYGPRLLLLVFALGLFFIFISTNSFIKEGTSYLTTIFFLLGLSLLIIVGIILNKLDKRLRNSLIIIFLVYFIFIFWGAKYAIKIPLYLIIILVLFLIVGGIFLVRYIYQKNISKIEEREQELLKATEPSNWLYKIFGLREKKK